MIFKLSSSDRALLSFKDIVFDKAKDYSQEEAVQLVGFVQSAMDSYSNYNNVFEEELYLNYEELLQKIENQINSFLND